MESAKTVVEASHNRWVFSTEETMVLVKAVIMILIHLFCERLANSLKSSAHKYHTPQ